MGSAQSPSGEESIMGFDGLSVVVDLNERSTTTDRPSDSSEDM